MKNWQIPGLLAILIIGFLLISGCTQDNDKYCRENFPGTAYDPSSKMCEKIVTQIPNSKVTQDPLIGVWRLSAPSDFDIRKQFDNDGTWIEYAAFYSKGFDSERSGTWFQQTSNSYVFRDIYEGKERSTPYVYDPSQDVIYPEQYPNQKYSRYRGTVEVTLSVTAATPTTKAKPTTATSSPIDPNTVLNAGQYQLSDMWYEIEGSYGYLHGTVKNTGTTYTDYIGFTGTLYDANGAVLVQGMDVTTGLAPGETGKFRIMFTGPGARMSFTRYFIKVEGYNFR